MGLLWKANEQVGFGKQGASRPSQLPLPFFLLLNQPKDISAGMFPSITNQPKQEEI